MTSIEKVKVLNKTFWWWSYERANFVDLENWGDCDFLLLEGKNCCVKRFESRETLYRKNGVVMCGL